MDALTERFLALEEQTAPDDPGDAAAALVRGAADDRSRRPHGVGRQLRARPDGRRSNGSAPSATSKSTRHFATRWSQIAGRMHVFDHARAGDPARRACWKQIKDRIAETAADARRDRRSRRRVPEPPGRPSAGAAPIPTPKPCVAVAPAPSCRRRTACTALPCDRGQRPDGDSAAHAHLSGRLATSGYVAGDHRRSMTGPLSSFAERDRSRSSRTKGRRILVRRLPFAAGVDQYGQLSSDM